MKLFGYRWKTGSSSDPRTFSLTIDLEDGLWFACLVWRRRRHELRVQPISAGQLNNMVNYAMLGDDSAALQPVVMENCKFSDGSAAIRVKNSNGVAITENDVEIGPGVHGVSIEQSANVLVSGLRIKATKP